MRGQVSTRVVSGNDIDQHSSMSGSVTLMLHRIGTQSHSKFIVSMRMRKSVSTQGEFWISSMEHLHLWSSPQLSGGMGKECLMYHSRLAQLIAIKKGEQYAKTISWIRTRTSFALLRSALVCLRGSRTRRVPCDIKNVDIDVEVVEGAIQSDY